jgi:predicted 3-demethylubiquinone-9 3-methyltransferase (glyoxalase superfamily)
MPTNAAPFLMFQGVLAEEAMQLYISAIPDSEILEVQRYGTEGPGPAGSVMLARFSVAGLTVLCSDSFITHAFAFTPSSSLFVDFESEQDLDKAANILLDGGQWLMEPANYGFSKKFGWLNDRYGVSWQLNLKSLQASALYR